MRYIDCCKSTRKIKNAPGKTENIFLLQREFTKKNV